MSGSAARRAFDGAFAISLSMLLALAFWSSRDGFFILDDWLILRQGARAGGLFDDYNGHLSTVIVALYRALAEAFGFRYVPFLVTGLVSLFAAPLAYYLLTRRLLTAPLAAVLALSWFACEQAWLGPGELNHFLALAGGIGCAAALDRGRAADPWLAAGLTFALASSGAGVAVMAGCLVHAVCVRAPVRRWVAVLGPSIAWVLWWSAVGRHYEPHGEDITVGQALEQAWGIAVGAFEALGLHSRVLGWGLLVGHLALGASLLRRGFGAAANWLAWTAGLAAWVVGVGLARGESAAGDVSRYQFIAIGFILLSLVPRRQPGWVARIEQRSSAAIVVGLSLGILLVGAARAPSQARDTTIGELVDSAAPLNRGRVVVAALGADALPDATSLGPTMGFLTAAEVRQLLDRYGYPFDPSVSPDALLVRVGAVEVAIEGRSRPASCPRLEAPFQVSQATAADPLLVWAPEEPVTIELRRFGQAWVPVHTADPGSIVRLRLPALESDTPWEVKAVGACGQVPRAG